MYFKTSKLSLFLVFILGCSAPKEKIPDKPLMATASGQKLVIYQMMTRLFGNQNTTNKIHGTLEENGVGKFNDINETALNGIKRLGATHIWYTGVIEHALITDYTSYGIPLDDADVVKGRAGSPYSIKDYYDVSPDLAVDVKSRMKEFEALVSRTHSQGVKVIIDFVPNHVARVYHSDVKPEGVVDLGEEDDRTVEFKANNNFYYLPGQSFQSPKGYNPLGANSFQTKDGKFEETPAKVSGNDQFTASPGINEWFEAVKLNYGIDIQQGRKKYFEPIPNTWEKMRDILIYWANKKVDGFRCDMAEMVPVEFWNWVIPQVKAVNSEIIFIAEIYNPSQYRNYIDNGRFDFLYDKVQLYDTLRLLINQKSSSEDIPKIQVSLSGINSKMVHFMENHDEHRIASKFFATDPWKAVPAMVISATIDKGPVMIYFGQEVGEPATGKSGFSDDDGQTSRFDYVGVPEHQKWVNGGKFDGGGLSNEQKQLRQAYADILSLATENKAISMGDYYDLTEFNRKSNNFSDKVHAFVRTFGDERLLIISGFTSKVEHIKIQLSQEVINRLMLDKEVVYIARDLLRSGTEIGFDSSFSAQLDVQPYSSLILKIKE
ncbi:MAG: alpha-amylase family protein [Bacteroidia bacterium]|nr:alpha-amylase family protein [Bacteroidia bacterium]